MTPPEIRMDQSDCDLEMGLGADPVHHSVALKRRVQVLASSRIQMRYYNNRSIYLATSASSNLERHPCWNILHGKNTAQDFIAQVF